MRTLRVLLVDDEPEILDLLATFLRRAGWVPLIARSGTEAEVITRMAKPNVIICDERLPGMRGSELMGRLGCDPDTAQIPVILMSGDDDGLAGPTRVAGLLAKPFTINQVLAAVESAVAPVHQRSVEYADDVAETADCSAAWAGARTPPPPHSPGAIRP